MDAVNLIPGDARKRQLSVSASPATLGLIAGLLVILAAAVLYVSAVNDVRGRRSELAKVTANVTAWQATANSYATLVASSQQRAVQLGAVRQLASSRFPWSQLLSQIAGLMPAKAALSTLQATTPTTSSTSTPGTSSAAPSTSTSAPSVQLTGCAQSQSTVAQAMVQLHKVTGVTDVTLASSSDAGTSTGSAPAGQNASCPFPVQFQVSMVLATPSPSAALSTASTSSASASATPTASPATTTTGSSQ